MLYLTHTWIKKLCLSGWCCSACTAPRSTGWECSEKTCSFIKKWWSVKTKSVHEKNGNSEKSFWKKKNACKTKTSNCHNALFKHLLNEEIKLILNAFSFSSAYFSINFEKELKFKYSASKYWKSSISTEEFSCPFPHSQIIHWLYLRH